MARTLVVGDIHGCIDELEELVERAGLGPGDRIVAVGDIVDRGPATPAVLRFFAEREGATSVMGNHERKHVRSFSGQVEAALSQRIARRQIGEASYPAAVGFMAALPAVVELPDAVVVHGFLEPGVPLADQDERFPCGVMSAEVQLKRSGRWPWYEHYDGDTPLVVGHLDYSGTRQPVVYRDRVYMLDTGCCHGGALSGLLLPDFRLLTVPSRGDYWSRVCAEHRDLVALPPEPSGQGALDPGSLARLLLEGGPLDLFEWHVVETILSAEAELTALGAEVAGRLDEVADLDRRGRRALKAVAHCVEEAARSAETEIRCRGVAVETLDAKAQYEVFAVAIGAHPLARYLYQVRRGQFCPDNLKTRFRTPAAMIEAAALLGSSSARR